MIASSKSALLAILSLTASAAVAQTAPTPAVPAADTVALTDEQRLAILDHITPESAAAARGEMSGQELAAHGIHGEIGAMIGSHGSSAVYGAANIPLGDNASATVMFEESRFGRYRR
jgi:hypothetical protein